MTLAVPALLDESQRAAVEIEPGHRQIVIAGPGSGKTEVVSRLVEHLVEEEDVDPTDGVLVISFSNAAVHAVDARLRARGSDPVAVQTLDALATQLVHESDAVDGERLDFDRRVVLATQLLRNEDAAATGRFDDVEHLVVDEVQDIVGVRADFLLAILEALRVETGFSLLGDPAQGIYDFQIKPDGKGRLPRSTTTSQEMLFQVSRSHDVVTKHLAHQYRAQSRDAKAAAALRAAALDGGDASALDGFDARVVSAGAVDDLAEVAALWTGTTALLTANNGQALLVADALAAAGARVEVRRSAQQRVLAGWIARLLGDAPSGSVSRAEVADLVAERMPSADTAVLWRALRSIVGGRGSEIDLGRLATRLRAPRAVVPDLLDSPGSPFVVSTVHRAKGLEFDNVVLVDFPHKRWLDVETDEAELRRVRFVALTRARRLIARASGPDDRWLRLLSRPGLNASRWYLTGTRPWMTFGFEMRIDDLDRSGPGGTDVAKAQEHLAHGVAAGDPLAVELDTDRSTLSVPVYTLSHEGIAVARTSPKFGEDLAARLGTLEKKRSGWPRLTGARVESVATVAGDRQTAEVGRHGLWLAPVVAGMLRTDWKGGADV